jgi:choloylglycine hydrolase
MMSVMLFDEGAHEIASLVTAPACDFTWAGGRIVWSQLSQFFARNRSRFVCGCLQNDHGFVIGERCDCFVLNVLSIFERRSSHTAGPREKLWVVLRADHREIHSRVGWDHKFRQSLEVFCSRTLRFRGIAKQHHQRGHSQHVLWLVESGYPSFDGIKPGLTIAAWAQYVLDNFATVREAVDALRSEPFTIVTDKVPGLDRLATLHLSISDATGDSAIIEYIGGKQVIHHDRKYQVMTNSPTFDQQLALNAYWQQIGGTVMLPGTNRASDRFARASFYINAIPKDEKNPAITLASVFGVIRNVSVPYGISTPNEPNISSTRWRTVADHKRKLYFFESVLTPNTFWVDLKAIDFSAATGKVRKLDLGENQTNIFSGDTTANFKEAQPFRFQGL